MGAGPRREGMNAKRRALTNGAGKTELHSGSKARISSREAVPSELTEPVPRRTPGPRSPGRLVK